MLISHIPEPLLVSIHAPREGCDWGARADRMSIRRFQFTHPGRGATTNCYTKSEDPPSFNSRTPGGVRQCGAKLRIMGRINKRNLRLAVLL